MLTDHRDRPTLDRLWILLGAVLFAVPAVLAAAIGALRDSTRGTTSRYPPAG